MASFTPLKLHTASFPILKKLSSPPDRLIIVGLNLFGDTESLIDFPVDSTSVTAYILGRPNIHFEARHSFALDRCGADRSWCIDGYYRLIVCAS